MERSSKVEKIEQKNFKNILINSFKTNIRQYTMIIALLVIWGVFGILTQGNFLTSRNISNLFIQSVTVAILAIGMVLILVSSNIDLGVGSVVAFVGSIAAVLQVSMNMGTIPTILICLVLGLMIGAFNGYWVAYRGVPAFIVTLASMLIFRGAVLGVTKGATIGPMNESFKQLGQGYLPKIFEASPVHDLSLIIAIVVTAIFVMMELNKRKKRIKYGFDVLPFKLEIAKIVLISIVIMGVFSVMYTYLGIPYSVIFVMILAYVMNFIATKTKFGKYVYAMGGNKEAARLSGINIKKTTMIIFMIMGVISAMAGVLFTGRLNAATASAGNMFELDAIAAAVIGGTSTLGGEGTIIGAIIGGLVMASLDNGMSLLNVDLTYQYIIKGLILLIAVWVDIATRKKNSQA